MYLPHTAFYFFSPLLSTSFKALFSKVDIDPIIANPFLALVMDTFSLFSNPQNPILPF